jgi:hypothetical protein
VARSIASGSIVLWDTLPPATSQANDISTVKERRRDLLPKLERQKLVL